MDKYIFLDIDGVLNSRDWFLSRYGKSGIGNIDPEAVSVLRKIIRRTDAKIILSSTWRDEYDIAEKFNKFTHGLELSGILCPFVDKAEALDKWMERYSSKKFRYVIIDDCFGYNPKYQDRWVEVDYEHGLTDDYVEKVVFMMEKN